MVTLIHKNLIIWKKIGNYEKVIVSDDKNVVVGFSKSFGDDVVMSTKEPFYGVIQCVVKKGKM
jgi:hypothetical protein